MLGKVKAVEMEHGNVVAIFVEPRAVLRLCDVHLDKCVLVVWGKGEVRK